MSLRADSRAGAARVCVQVHRERYRAQAVRHARVARRRHELLEHASPVLGSGLGKIGQAGDPGVVTSPAGPPGRGPRRSGARGAGALISPGGSGRGALSSVPQ